jgi:hypothetical protein
MDEQYCTIVYSGTFIRFSVLIEKILSAALYKGQFDVLYMVRMHEI